VPIQRGPGDYEHGDDEDPVALHFKGNDEEKEEMHNYNCSRINSLTSYTRVNASNVAFTRLPATDGHHD